MSSLMEMVRNYVRDRRALEELRKLDDRMLSDIGLRGVDLKMALKAKNAGGSRFGEATEQQR